MAVLKKQFSGSFPFHPSTTIKTNRNVFQIPPISFLKKFNLILGVKTVSISIFLLKRLVYSFVNRENICFILIV